MTNQSREAFEKWAGQHLAIYDGPSPMAGNVARMIGATCWDAWQAALSEGRRQGIEEAAQVLIENECSMTGVRAVRALIVEGREG